MKVTGVYKIQSKVHPERVYIGSSVDIYQRLQHHRRMLDKNTHHSPKLQDHYNKYGLDDLVFEVIEITKNTKSSLIGREQYYLDTLNPWFNVCKKADSRMGVPLSQHAKEALSKAKIGKPSWNKGKRLSPEHYLKTVEARRKRTTNTPGQNKKIGDAQRGRKKSAETRKKMSEKRKKQTPPMLGKKHSEETKKLMSKLAKERTGWVGRKLTEEHKKNIGIASKKAHQDRKNKNKAA